MRGAAPEQFSLNNKTSAYEFPISCAYSLITQPALERELESGALARNGQKTKSTKHYFPPNVLQLVKKITFVKTH